MRGSVESQLRRLMLFRVVMITTLLLVAIYVEAVSETLLPVNPLYFLVAATYTLTIAYVAALRAPISPRVHGYVQIVLDLVLVTGLVYVAGGTVARAGFMLLYPICVLSGSILLYRRSGLVLAGLATLSYALLLWAVRQQWVPAQGLPEVPHMALKQLLYSVFVTAVSCVTVALIGAYLSESLRSAGERLELATERVADLYELHRMVVSSMQSGLITADQEGRLVYVNAFGEGILGRPEPELRGRTLREVFGSVLLDTPALAARARDEGFRRLELRYESEQGVRDLGLSVSPLKGGDGGYLVVFQNLTDTKRLEREVRTKEQLAAVGEMAAYLAHEIRNPLGSISGSAQVLMGEPNISDEQERLLAIISRESRRLSDTLNQFLFQVKKPAGAYAPVDVGRVVEEAVTLLRNDSEVGDRHTVDFDIDQGPHVCLANPAEITQVFWNLARNGLEAMPHGGRLRTRVAAEGDELVLRVRDDGRGMGHEEQRRVFQPFESGSPMGTGLGLAIVYRIVREHRGDISIRSVPAQGTEVEVRLPLLHAAALA
jgi:two-component system sensor histidine kinase PilS (NtrC family)